MTRFLKYLPYIKALVPLLKFLSVGPRIQVLKNSKFYVAYDSGAMDVYASSDLTIFSKGSKVVQTGVKLSLPQLPFGLGVVAQVWPRSGLSCMKKVETGAGLIDTDYRGEIGIHLYNHSEEAVVLKRGDRVAQLCFPICVMPKGQVSIVDILSETERGSKGFGSTGN